MRTTAILSTLLLLFSYVAGQNTQTFGKKIDAKGAISGIEFRKLMENKDSAEVKFSGILNEVCQKKGCWTNVDLGNGESMMVRFKDYAFFLPKDAAGQKAVFQGKAQREVISVEALRHYAEDAGKSREEIEKITAPQIRLTFEAEGVLLYSKK